MTKEEQIVRVARSYIGTPYRHMGRLNGIGIDCLGLLVCVCKDLNIPYQDRAQYERYGNFGSLLAALQEQCSIASEPAPGRIGFFQFSTTSGHTGIFAENENGNGLTMIHAYQNAGKVTEHILIDWWRDKLIAVLEFPDPI